MIFASLGTWPAPFGLHTRRAAPADQVLESIPIQGPQDRSVCPAMTALLVVPMALALAAVAPALGWAAQGLLAAMLVVMLGTGQLVCRAVGWRDQPFLAIVLGFVLLSHALVVADRVVPGAHWQVLAALAIPAALGLLWRSPALRSPALRSRPGRWAAMAVAAMAALFTLAWNLDVAPRLAAFYRTGVLDFWLDVLVHAGNLAEFAAPDAIGRGMVLLADTPPPLYHYASFLPPALLTRVAGIPPLDATVLAWIPLGILIMACGVAALACALADAAPSRSPAATHAPHQCAARLARSAAWNGPALAILSLAALAILPAPERLTLGNGFLGFAWMLETAPGTPYSVGIACAALAALVRWTRSQRPGALLLALALTAGCFLVRANTFVWLAPTVALGVLAGWRRLGVRRRLVLVALGVLALTAFLAALSWPALRADPLQFIFGYVEFVQLSSGPTHFDGLYPMLSQHLGRVCAGLVAVGLTLLGTLGPWLPVFVILGLIIGRRRLAAEDALPVLLLGVAALAMLLDPVARNGDVTEFRQRSGPLLVAVTAVWSVRYAMILTAPWQLRLTTPGRRGALAGAAGVALAVLALTIDAAKRPAMAWGVPHHRSRVAPELMQLAPLLARTRAARPRFVVANQPADARVIDDAARLVALSGVPAYVSCPAFLLATGGQIGQTAQRRMAVVPRLAAAPDLAALRQIMQAEGITHYIAETAQDAAFDPDRRAALGHVGAFAVYAAAAPG